MNKEVSFEVKQLLFNKGWRYELGLDETGHRVKHSLAEERWNQGHLNYVDITIAEVVMWLYEKHGIWIMVEMTGSKKFYPRGRMIDKKGKHHVGDFKYNNERLIYNTPTEAYEAAIEYTLNNLIQKK